MFVCMWYEESILLGTIRTRNEWWVLSALTDKYHISKFFCHVFKKIKTLYSHYSGTSAHKGPGDQHRASQLER